MSTVLIAHGPRAVEARLLDEVAHAAAAGAARPGELASPLRVVVPSTSLLWHVSARLAQRCGALLGVRVQTLSGVAHEILERAGEERRAGDALFPIVVRHEARAEPALRHALDALEDGYAIVAETVADLLDAGLEPEHTAALAGRLAGLAAGERGSAVLRVAARVAERLRTQGIERDGERLARAAQRLAADGRAVLPARAVWIHGFAEATGRASRLLAELVDRHGARVLIDRPPSPLEPGAPDPAGKFTERLEARVGGAGGPVAEPVATPQLELLHGPGAHAELRAVARAIRALLDAGERPEQIGVVARVLDPYVVPLRLHLGRLGIPFSGHERAGPSGPSGRRLAALVELLRRRERTSVDRWLDALGFLPALGSRRVPEPRRNPLRSDLSLALHALGAGRLEDVAGLDVAERLGEREWLPLPVRRGLSGGGGDDDPPRAPRRRLRRETLAAAVDCARRVCRWFETASAGSAAQRGASLRELVEQELGWTEAVPGQAELESALESLALELGDRVPLEHGDLVLLLERALRELGRVPLGGRGGGVQVLDVTQARARTFEHLFLIGMNRDVFPRVIREDPLLPDALREALAAELPEIPIKRRGHQEEAYLYAQLLSASPRVLLSWQTMDEEGVARSPSSLVVRQKLAQPALPQHAAPPLWVPAGGPRPAHEHAVLAGLYGPEPRARTALEASLRHEHPLHAEQAGPLARARVRVRSEFDGRAALRAELGPWYGFVGPARAGDPRHADLYVTTLEGYGRCPWQSFLRRILRVEAIPDALDALPRVDALLLGSVVHATLEAIVRSAGPERPEAVEALRGQPPVHVPWPDTRSLDALLERAAREALLEGGVDLPGFARALASQARPYVERARDLVWRPAGDKAPVLGAEVTGVVEVHDGRGTARSVSFRADLLERSGAGLRLSDYKTGAPVSWAKGADTRRTHLRARVRAGTALQALAYRLGAGEANAVGRYLFLRPDLAEELAVVELGPDDELEGDFRQTARILLDGQDAGVFLPRLVEAASEKEPRTCEWCELAEACVRGDSTARRRLLEWARRTDGSEPEARALFSLGVEDDA